MKLGMKIRCGRFKGEDGRWRTRMCPTPGFLCRVGHGRSSGICISSNKFIFNYNPVLVWVIRIKCISLTIELEFRIALGLGQQDPCWRRRGHVRRKHPGPGAVVVSGHGDGVMKPMGKWKRRRKKTTKKT